MNVVIIGSGYVGLTTGAVLSYFGNQVTCIDVDERKIATLAAGGLPIFEPHLPDLLALARKGMTFTTGYEAIRAAEVVFIAVGTPALPDGNPDLTYLDQAAGQIATHLGMEFTAIVNKSTVPIGSGNWVEAIINEKVWQDRSSRPDKLAVASNPEFLREGSAIFDTLYPDRIVIGADDARAIEILLKLYRPIIDQSFPAPSFLPRPDQLTAVPVVTTSLTSAELIKYSANAFLALKISFINEIACIAEKVGADVTQIARGIGLDNRIGTSFLNAGIGWGGSCFGKDTAALLATAREYNLAMPTIEAARQTNSYMRDRVVEKLANELKILKGKTVALLGLAFKPFTDDLRDSPSVDIAQRLIQRGVKVIAHDPAAMDRAREELGSTGICFSESIPALFNGTDAVVLVTEWPDYQQLPWVELRSKMRNPIVLDGRNFLDKDHLEQAGYKYMGVGR
jgi:UDPglucose 6-dehydrogenase